MKQPTLVKNIAVCACLSLLTLSVFGCNEKDANALKEDTKKLSDDIGPILKNSSLAAKVTTHLTLHKGVDMTGLHIDSQDGVATVSGHVKDANAKKVIISVVKETTGVDKVVDKLEIAKP